MSAVPNSARRALPAQPTSRDIEKLNKFSEAIPLYEEAFAARRTMADCSVEQRDRDFAKLVGLLNRYGNDLIAKGNVTEAETVLSKLDGIVSVAADISEPVVFNMRNIAYHTIGMFFLRTDKPRTALRYFTKLLYIENALHISSTATYLNLCNALSRMGRHHRALEAAQAALSDALRGHSAAALAAPGSGTDSGSTRPASRGSGGGGAVQSGASGVDPSLVAAARHSAAVQLEHVGRRTEALAVYQTALASATEELGPTHEMTLALRKAVAAVKRDLAAHPRVPAPPPVTMQERIAASTKFDPGVHSPRVARHHRARTSLSQYTAAGADGAEGSQPSPYLMTQKSALRTHSSSPPPRRARSTAPGPTPASGGPSRASHYEDDFTSLPPLDDGRSRSVSPSRAHTLPIEERYLDAHGPFVPSYLLGGSQKVMREAAAAAAAAASRSPMTHTGPAAAGATMSGPARRAAAPARSPYAESPAPMHRAWRLGALPVASSSAPSGTAGAAGSAAPAATAEVAATPS